MAGAPLSDDATAAPAAEEVALVDWRLHAFGAHVRRSHSGGGCAARFQEPPAGECGSLSALHHLALDRARLAVEGWCEQAVGDPQRRYLWLWAAAAAATAGGRLRRRASPVARWRSFTLGLLGRRACRRLALACWRLAARRRSLLAAAGRNALVRSLNDGPGSPIAAAIISRRGSSAQARSSPPATPPTAHASGVAPASPSTASAPRGAAYLHSSLDGSGGEYPPAQAAAQAGDDSAGAGSVVAEVAYSRVKGLALDTGEGPLDADGRALDDTEGEGWSIPGGGWLVRLGAQLALSWRQRDSRRLLLRWRSEARSLWSLRSGLKLSSAWVRRRRLRVAVGAWAAAALRLNAGASLGILDRLAAASRAAARRQQAFAFWAWEFRRGRRTSLIASAACASTLRRRGWIALRRRARHAAAAAVGAELFISGRWVGRSRRSGLERWLAWRRGDAACLRLQSRGLLHCAVRAARAEATALSRLRAHAAARRGAAAACDAWQMLGALTAWRRHAALDARVVHLHAVRCLRTLGRRAAAGRRQRQAIAAASAVERASLLGGGWVALTAAVVAARAAKEERAGAVRRARAAALRRWAAAPRMRVLRMVMVAQGGQRYGCVRAAVGGWCMGGRDTHGHAHNSQTYSTRGSLL